MVCKLQKLHQLKEIGPHLPSLSQHLPCCHHRCLQFMTRTVHRFLQATCKRLLTHYRVLHLLKWNIIPEFKYRFEIAFWYDFNLFADARRKSSPGGLWSWIYLNSFVSAHRIKVFFLGGVMCEVGISKHSMCNWVCVFGFSSFV